MFEEELCKERMSLLTCRRIIYRGIMRKRYMQKKLILALALVETASLAAMPNMCHGRWKRSGSAIAESVPARRFTISPKKRVCSKKPASTSKSFTYRGARRSCRRWRQVRSSSVAVRPLKSSAHIWPAFRSRFSTALINKFVYSFVTPTTVVKPQDLKGRAVAISRFGSGSDFITRLALKSWGLEPMRDVTILQVGNSPERLAAIVGGKVHGSILSLSQTPRAKALGLRVLADLSQIDAEYPQGVLYVSSCLDRKTPGLDAELFWAHMSRRFVNSKRINSVAYKIIAKKQRLEGPRLRSKSIITFCLKTSCWIIRCRL